MMLWRNLDPQLLARVLVRVTKRWRARIGAAGSLRKGRPQPSASPQSVAKPEHREGDGDG